MQANGASREKHKQSRLAGERMRLTVQLSNVADAVCTRSRRHVRCSDGPCADAALDVDVVGVVMLAAPSLSVR
jgi:hypothetical protein